MTDLKALEKTIRALAAVIRKHGTCAPAALDHCADQLAAALAAQEAKPAPQPAKVEGCVVPADMPLGETMFTPRSEEVRFAYTRGQPDNLNAWRIGEACRRAADASAGDYIDRGLVLLRELESRGYGVFRFAAPQPGDGEVGR